MSAEETIIMYGTTWCPDCVRAKKFFDKNDIVYKYIDISNDPDCQLKVEELNDGMRVVPTIIFPDGDVLVEPSNKELREKIEV